MTLRLSSCCAQHCLTHEVWSAMVSISSWRLGKNVRTCLEPFHHSIHVSFSMDDVLSQSNFSRAIILYNFIIFYHTIFKLCTRNPPKKTDPTSWSCLMSAVRQCVDELYNKEPPQVDEGCRIQAKLHVRKATNNKHRSIAPSNTRRIIGVGCPNFVSLCWLLKYPNAISSVFPLYILFRSWVIPWLVLCRCLPRSTLEFQGIYDLSTWRWRNWPIWPSWRSFLMKFRTWALAQISRASFECWMAVRSQVILPASPSITNMTSMWSQPATKMMAAQSPAISTVWRNTSKPWTPATPISRRLQVACGWATISRLSKFVSQSAARACFISSLNAVRFWVAFLWLNSVSDGFRLEFTRFHRCASVPLRYLCHFLSKLSVLELRHSRGCWTILRIKSTSHWTTVREESWSEADLRQQWPITQSQRSELRGCSS